MLYAFKCRECGVRIDRMNVKNPHPCDCGGILRRDFSFSFRPPLREHFNHALGQYVSSERSLEDGFKLASEKQSELTGADHKYIPVDPRDMKGLNVTEEGLDSQRQAWIKKGLEFK